MAGEWAGVFGKFLEGYMKGSAQATEQKQQKITGMMNMAHQFALRADTEQDETFAKFYEEQGHALMDEATKLQSEKVGIWHLLSKITGGGKGKKIDALGPTILQATAPKAAAGAQPDQTAPIQTATPEQAAQNVQQRAQDEFAGWTPQPGETFPQGAPMTRQPAGVGTQGTPQAAPPVGVSAVTAPAGGAQPPSIPTSIGGRPLSRELQRTLGIEEFRAGRAAERAKSAAEETAHMSMEHNKEMFTWQAETQEKYNLESADRWAGTESAKQLQKSDPQLHQDIMQFKQFGVPIRDRSYQLREQDSPADRVTGKRSRQLVSVDARSGAISKLGPAEELPPNPHDLEVQPYMQGGKTYAEGEAAWAKDQMSENDLAKQMKILSVERTQGTITAQQQLNKLRQQKLEGKVDAAWAKNFEAIARPLSFQSGYVRDEAGMITGWDFNKSMAAFIQIIQFYGGMEWSEFQKLRGKTDTGKSTDEDNATWFLNEMNKQKTAPQTAFPGGSRGAPAPGTALKLPGGR